ncbi:amidohydrolase [Deinococcus soli (ex Cha et al. 2016)]|uniref:Amidohydrolase n=1 Tax=Deinococcus soli (ex Cha et al. 2016) TaxID=1309411 RepID=A0A0F7JQK8_9DEIO|nr:amidohydrolase [Deinococcus soli (ex Cha et al. 2016)]AKH16790.1 amidohydrolase [Deinococcus soli (ex Cha et al. 2016)]
MRTQDLTVVLARVFTLDDARPEVGAVLVGGGRVLAVGAREDVAALAPGAQVLDHRDLLLTPGLAEAHIHLVTYGFSLSQVGLHGARSVAEVQARVAQQVMNTPRGTWIRGGGFLLSELGLSGYPTAALLDEVSPHHPVLLYSRDLHLSWANSAALRLAGIHEGTPDPEGGRIVRPLGCLLEHASDLVARVIPEPTGAEYLAAARAGAADLAARGYVSAHTMAFESPEAPRALQTLAQQSELPLRVWACLPHDRLGHARVLGLARAPGGLFQWGGVKFFADGALGSRTAWLHAPGFADGSGTGMPLDPPELIAELGREAIELGLTPVTHAIGDRANTEVLNAYDRLRPHAEARGIRLRVEHAQHLRAEDLPRFRGLTASVQPIHLQADGPMIRDLMPHLESLSYAFRSLRDAGAILAFGSDAPVAPPEYRANFAAAITRVDDSGARLAPEQALTEHDVLWAHTRGPALAAGWDDEGIIRPGARAAFTLWDRLGGNAQALVLEG